MQLISTDYPTGGIGLKYWRKDNDCAGGRSSLTVPDEKFLNCTTTTFDCFAATSFAKAASHLKNDHQRSAVSNGVKRIKRTGPQSSAGPIGITY